MRKAGFSANDYYLKVLIEEWCEGVLCSRNRDDSSAHFLKKRTEQHKPYYLLFDKVATHLQKDKECDRVIDVRGLSKVLLLQESSASRFLLEFFCFKKKLCLYCFNIAGPKSG